jgi:cysteine desulfurase
MLMALDLQGIACSGGSACQSGSVGASHVMAALGLEAELGGAAIRMSLGALTTEACITRVAEAFSALALKARGLASVA